LVVEIYLFILKKSGAFLIAKGRNATTKRNVVISLFYLLNATQTVFSFDKKKKNSISIFFEFDKE
jgi:hypothetical protein